MKFMGLILEGFTKMPCFVNSLTKLHMAFKNTNTPLELSKYNRTRCDIET